MKRILVPNPPFDFCRMLERPASRPSQVMRVDPAARYLLRAFRVHNTAVPVAVTSTGTIDAPELHVEFPDGLSSEVQGALFRRLEHTLSLCVPISKFAETMSQIQEWTGLLQRFHGLRPILDADLFESMIRTIIGQQLHVRVAATLVERIVALGGESLVWNGELLPVFPSPEQVAGWSYHQLRGLAFSQRKAEYIIDFARAVVAGTVDLDALATYSDDQIYETLLPLRGIGRWTVECFLLFGLGRQDVMPAADIGIQNAVQKLYSLASRPTEATVRELSDPWKPWRSYATYYLWHSLIPSAYGF